MPRIYPGRSSGEPQLTQRLLIDFSPRMGDTEEQNQKCLQFWSFISSHPKFKKLLLELQEEKICSKTTTIRTQSTDENDFDVLSNHMDFKEYPCIAILQELEKRDNASLMMMMKKGGWLSKHEK